MFKINFLTVGLIYTLVSSVLPFIGGFWLGSEVFQKYFPLLVFTYLGKFQKILYLKKFHIHLVLFNSVNLKIHSIDRNSAPIKFYGNFMTLEIINQDK